jgi:hypothetical protein
VVLLILFTLRVRRRDGVVAEADAVPSSWVHGVVVSSPSFLSSGSVVGCGRSFREEAVVG